MIEVSLTHKLTVQQVGQVIVRAMAVASEPQKLHIDIGRMLEQVADLEQAADFVLNNQLQLLEDEFGGEEDAVQYAIRMREESRSAQMDRWVLQTLFDAIDAAAQELYKPWVKADESNPEMPMA